MPRKVKQKQRQKQKQSQTVIVNVGRSRGKGSKQERRPPPPSPQFVPYPVPALRGPDPVVPSQASLIQLLEAVRSIQAPVIARVPAPAVPAPVSRIIAEGKEEAGPDQMVGADDPLIGGDQPLVYTKPRIRRPILAPVAAEAASSSTDNYLTEEQLNRMPVGNKDAQPGRGSLRSYAREIGAIIPRKANKSRYIELILQRQNVRR